MSGVHRLGMPAWFALAALWLTLTALAARRESASRRRTARVLGTERRPTGRRGRRLPLRGVPLTWLGPLGVASAAYVLLGGVTGLVAGAALGYGARRYGKRTRTAHRPDASGQATEAERQLPLAADLLAACVAAGAGPVAAAQAVGESLKGPVGERLARGAAEVRLGGEPSDAWRQLAAMPGAAALARLLERAGESGAPAADPVSRLAADARAERGRAATARARRAAVLMTAPVGLCFLPAFVTVGVLPVVIGMAEGLLGAQ
ncbi:type II secretion system F family protein [Streptomyces silaceus]|uniref:type II secretion system F family protein n=1 Tax=Streptomyces silaceus TaxID=545123 RepID=UPI0006EB47B7|nr:type II secretion system F family protein [Streptomyces silaceus]